MNNIYITPSKGGKINKKRAKHWCRFQNIHLKEMYIVSVADPEAAPKF